MCVCIRVRVQNDGRLRLAKQNVVYKSSKTGRVDNIPAAELSAAQWRRVCLGHGIKLSTSSGHVYKYDGFRDTVSQGVSTGWVPTGGGGPAGSWLSVCGSCWALVWLRPPPSSLMPSAATHG